jgi:hypothetical protein
LTVQALAHTGQGHRSCKDCATLTVSKKIAEFRFCTDRFLKKTNRTERALVRADSEEKQIRSTEKTANRQPMFVLSWR